MKRREKLTDANNWNWDVSKLCVQRYHKGQRETHHCSCARDGRVSCTLREKGHPGQSDQHPPRSSQNGHSHSDHILRLVDWLLLVLEFHGSGCSESNTGDYREVDKESENPFEFLVDAIDTVNPSIVVLASTWMYFLVT